MEITKTIILSEKDFNAIFKTLSIFESILYELDEDVPLMFIDSGTGEVVSYAYQDEIDNIISLLSHTIETRMVINIS